MTKKYIINLVKITCIGILILHNLRAKVPMSIIFFILNYEILIKIHCSHCTPKTISDNSTFSFCQTSRRFFA